MPEGLSPAQRDYGIHWGDDTSDPDYPKDAATLGRWWEIPDNMHDLTAHLRRRGWSLGRLDDVLTHPWDYEAEYWEMLRGE